MQNHDILLLQEHWLFNFELQKLNKIDPEILASGKSIDMNNPIPPTQKPRGFGGTAVLWKRKHDHLVSSLPDGDHRIQAIQYQLSTYSLLIIAVYMPCRGSTNADTEFQIVLDQLTEILRKFPNSTPLIGGDWNAELQKTPTTKRQKMLSTFIEENHLDLLNDAPTGPTFIHPNGNDCTTIDYILCSSETTGLNSSVKKLDMLSGNTSDHYPISYCIRIDVDLPHHINAKQKTETQKHKKIIWEKLDTREFAQKTDELIPEHRPPRSIAELELQIVKLQRILLQAAEDLTCSPPKSKRKKRSGIWSDNIKQATIASRDAHFQWKNAGKPKDKDHPSVIRRKQAKKELRQHLRITQAKRRNDEIEKILNASDDNKKLFFSIINTQRQSSSSRTSELILDDITYTTEEDICKAWRLHFAKLATPHPLPSYDKEYTQQVYHDYLVLETATFNEPITKIQFTYKELLSAINALNTGKAPDAYGLAAEHLKYAGANCKEYILSLMNSAATLGGVPESMKKGILTPIFKKKNEKNKPTNYRGITVIAVLGKLWEKLLKQHVIPILNPTQNKQQRGFTRGTSPLNTALLLHEQIREATARKKPLYIAFLDAKAAFDVVNHHSLLRKLYLDGIHGHLWHLMSDTFKHANTTIKWGSYNSEPFSISQGVRQGGTLSADQYKRYNNTFLDWTQDMCTGGKLGATRCPAPTCADDTALVADSHEDLQTLLNAAYIYSSMEGFQLQPAKCMILAINTATPSQILSEHTPWRLGPNPVPVVEQAPHLGIIHDGTSLGVEPTIAQNIKKARGALYALMGAGLHGKNGLTPKANIHLIEIYILPILLHGLEILLPSIKQLKHATDFYESTLQQLLTLPTSVAKIAPYILTGSLPLIARIHTKAITMFGSIARNKETLEWEIAERQIHYHTEKSYSWFHTIKRILCQYSLPAATTILYQTPTKEQWKVIVKKAVTQYWKEDFTSKLTSYPSLKYLSVHLWTPGKIHHILDSISYNSQDIRRTPAICRIVTGTMSLQSNRAQFNQTNNKICLLCKIDVETRDHFIRTCPKLEPYRAKICDELRYLLPHEIIPADPRWTQYILDPLHQDHEIPVDRDNIIQIISVTRRLCQILQMARMNILSSLPTRKKDGL